MISDTQMLGMNKDFQKRANRGLMLKLIATESCLTRTELAARTGLTKTAISQIINELISKDYIVEKGSRAKTELGRNPVRLDISPDAPEYIGVTISRRFCEVVLCDMKANIKRKETVVREWENAGDIMRSIFSICDRFIRDAKKIAAIGVSCIGPVNIKEGRMLYPLRFHGIGNLPIKKDIEDRYHLPTFFDHDNQSAVLAEQLYGNAKNYNDVLLVGLGRGVGCGILVDGQRVQSYTGYAPEIGHVSIDQNGTQCICGNRGCLENYVRTDVIVNDLIAATGKELSYEEFCSMPDDPAVDRILKEAARKISVAIVNTLNILNSQIVILTLDFCAWDDKYIRYMEEEINSRKFGNRDITIPVRKALFLESAGTIGAACNAINYTFTGNLLQ